MNRSTLRAALLATSAASLLAACSGGGDNVNAGTTGPVTIGGGTGGGNASVDFDFVGANGCPAGLPEVTVTQGNRDILACGLSGSLVSDLTLDAGSAYAIQGSVFVGESVIGDANARRATLTVPAGTVLFGASGRDALFVSPGSRLEAEGTADRPIIMTSAADLADGSAGATAAQAASDGTTTGGADARGQWGGLVISGLAPINDCGDTQAAPGTAGCTKDGEGGSGLFGGDDPNDDSGSLAYLRVQYAGFAFSSDNELNGIAFQGVGDGTEVSFVQVHNNQDDGVEFFGGTVDADHLVVTGAGDDSIDWTDGWTGTLQYAVVVHTAGDGDRAIEGDNRGDDVDVTPRSNPTIANFTFLGRDDVGSDGVKLRAGTDATLLNGIVVGFGGGEGLDFDADSAAATPEAYSLFVAENAAPFDGDAAPIFGASDSNVSAAGASLDGLFAGALERDVDATDADDVDAPNADEVEDTDYIGAFSDDEDEIEESWLAGWTLTAPFPNTQDQQGCPAGTIASTTAVPVGRAEARVCTIQSPILSDVSLTRGNLYELVGTVFVGEDQGGDADTPLAGADSATLTVAPGVTVFGASGRDALVIRRGSRIEVNGSASLPVVMTSLADVQDPSRDDDGVRGEWGGLVINGRAPINDCGDTQATPGTAGCEKDGEGGSGLFGGGAPEDDSGNINYLRIQYAGFAFSSSNELNGIAFQGVGSGTEDSHVQVHNNQDDGVEFFGGTVNARYLVITGAGDDSIDWTDGWTGNLQYAIVAQATDDGDRPIEADNRGDDVDVTPRSNPTLSNLTLIGNGSADVVKLRAGTDAEIYNSVLLAQGQGDGIDFDRESAANPVPTFFSTFVTSVETAVADGEGDLFLATNNNVDGVATGQGSTLTADGTAFALVPGANEGSVAATDLDDDFFDEVDFIGAVEDADDDWYQGWTIRL